MPTQNLLRLYTVTDIDAETHVSDSLSASKQKVQVEEVNQICRSLGTGMHAPPSPTLAPLMEFVQNFTPPDFQVKNLNRQFYLISTVLVRKNTKN